MTLPRMLSSVLPATLAITAMVGMASAVEPSGPAEIASWQAMFEARVHEGASGQTLPYRIAGPPEARGDAEQKFPVVLFLHGAGERGNDNVAQLKHGVWELMHPERRTTYPAYVIAPQCPLGQRWVDTDWDRSDGAGSFSRPATPAMTMAMELVDLMCERDDVDASRIYVTGLSMGGYGSWYAAGHYNDVFAGMLAVCGGGDETWADRYDAIPVWAVHGDNDQAVSVTRSRSMIAALAVAGHAGEIRYTELPGVGHDSWTVTYRDDNTWRWLFGQARKTP